MKYIGGLVLVLLLLMGLVVTVIWASDGRPGQGRMGPPPEAIEACKGKTEGAAVEFKDPRGQSVKAICRSCNSSLAAVPEGFGPPPPSTNQASP
jgi:hypothetical protein